MSADKRIINEARQALDTALEPPAINPQEKR